MMMMQLGLLQVLLFLIIILTTTIQEVNSQKQQRQPSLFEFSQFTESDALERCRDDLIAIGNENSDNQLDRNEYTTFLLLQTGGELSSTSGGSSGGVDDFQQIPFRLQTVYLSAACWCEVVDPNDNQCCLDGKDRIPLDTNASSLVDPYLFFFCINVQKGLTAEGFVIISPSPTEIPTISPTASPSDVPSDVPSFVPTVSPSIAPTAFPSDLPSETPTTSPSIVPTAFPSDVPSETPSITTEPPTTESPTSVPTPIPSIIIEEIPVTPAPTLPTLCIDFQYVVRNQVGLDADAIFNEEDNNVLQGLQLATRLLTIEILNGTYPPQRRLYDLDGLDEDRVGENVLSISHTEESINKRQLSQQQETFIEHRQQRGNSASIKLSLRGGRQLIQHDRRHLAYYTDDIPVAINSVTDNPLCAGSEENPRIRCSIVSSTVCVVLEEGDDPSEVRAFLISGLRQAVDSGDFLTRIPAGDLTT